MRARQWGEQLKGRVGGLERRGRCESEREPGPIDLAFGRLNLLGILGVLIDLDYG